MGRPADTLASIPPSPTMNCTDLAPTSLREAFRGATIETIDARVEGHASVVLTRVRHAAHGFGFVEFMPPADGYLVGMSLTPPAARATRGAGRRGRCRRRCRRAASRRMRRRADPAG